MARKVNRTRKSSTVFSAVSSLASRFLTAFAARDRIKNNHPAVPMERMEDRLLLAGNLNLTAGALSFTAAAGITNNLTITVGATTLTFADTADTITLNAAAITAGWTGSGTGTVTGPTASFTSISSVNLGDKNDTLSVNDLAASASRTVALSGASITGAGVSFPYTLTTTSTLNVNLTGLGNTVNVTGIPCPTFVNTGVGGNDTFNVGTAAHSLAGILYPLFMTSGGGNDSITLDDSLDPSITPSTVSIGSGSVTGLSPGGVFGYTHSGGNLTLNVLGRAPGNTFNIDSTVAAPTVSILNVTGGAGTDVFNVGVNSAGTVRSFANLNGTINLVGAAGTNTVNLDDSTNNTGDTFTLTSAAFSGTNFSVGLASFSTGPAAATVNINGSTAADTFHLNGFTANTNYNVDGKGGADTYNVAINNVPLTSTLNVTDADTTVPAKSAVTIDAGGVTLSTITVQDAATPTIDFKGDVGVTRFALGNGNTDIGFVPGTVNPNSVSVRVLFAPGAGDGKVTGGVTDAFLLPLGKSFTVPQGDVHDIQATGSAGNNALTVDFNGTNPIPAAGFTWNGGAGFDSLNLLDSNAAPIVITNEIAQPTNATDGTISFNGNVLTYLNLSPIIDTVPATSFTFNAIGATANIATIAGTHGRITSTASSFESHEFANKVSVTIAGPATAMDFADTLTGAPTGMTSLTLTGGAANDIFTVGTTDLSIVNYALNINGGGNGIAPGDTLTLNDSTNAITGAAYTLSNTSFTGTSFTGQINYSGIETFPITLQPTANAVLVTGLPDGTAATIDGKGGIDAYTVDAGGIGSVTGASLTINDSGAAAPDTLAVDAGLQALTALVDETTVPSVRITTPISSTITVNYALSGLSSLAFSNFNNSATTPQLTMTVNEKAANAVADTTALLGSATLTTLTLPAGLPITYPIAAPVNVTVNASNDQNTLDVNFGGVALNALGANGTGTGFTMHFGDNPADRIYLHNGSAGAETLTATGAAAGTIAIGPADLVLNTPVATSPVLTYSNLESIDDTLTVAAPGLVTINTLGAAVDVVDGALVPAVTGVQTGLVRTTAGTNFVPVQYGNKANVIVSTSPGANVDNTINFDMSLQPAGLAQLQVSGNDGADTFNVHRVAAPLNVTLSGNNGNDTFNIVGGLANKPGRLHIDGNAPVLSDGLPNVPPGDTINLDAVGVVEIYTDPILGRPATKVRDLGAGGNSLDFTSIETFNLTATTVRLLGDRGDARNAGVTNAEDDTFTVVGTGINAADVRVNSVPADGATIHVMSGNGKIFSHIEAFGGAGNDLLNVTPYADNTPVGWGIDIAYDGSRNGVVADGEINTLMYLPNSSQLNRVSNQVTVNEATQAGAGQLNALNASSGTTQVIVNFTNTQVVDVHANDGTLGDTDTLTINANGAANAIAIDELANTVALDNSFTVNASANLIQYSVNGGAGNDVFTVTGADNESNPNAPQVNIDGGTGVNRLIPVDTGTGDLTLIRKSFTPGSGAVTIGILKTFTYANIQVVQPSSPVDGQVVVVANDPYEYNNDLANATYFGAGQSINLQASVDAADADLYRVQPSLTGVLDTRLTFTRVVTVPSGRPGLPGNGDLTLQILDASGNQVAIQNGLTSGQRIIAPVVAGQTYYVRVTGTTVSSVNNYGLTVNNQAAPASVSVAINPADDTGGSTTDNLTRNATPRLVVQADLQSFKNLGIAILSPANATLGTVPGVAVEIFNNGVHVGWATLDTTSSLNTSLFNYTFLAGQLVSSNFIEGMSGAAFNVDNKITAAVRVFDGTNTDRVTMSSPLVLRVDTVKPAAPTAPQLFPTSGASLVFDGAPVETLTGAAATTAGTFTLSYAGNTTGPLAYNAATSDVQTALQLLPGLSGVVVSGSPLTSLSGMVFNFPANMLNTQLLSIGTTALTPSTGYAINSNGIITTSVTTPTFWGTAEANSIVRIFAVDPANPSQSRLIGQGLTGSDASDSIIGDGMGRYQITVEPLAYGFYTIKAKAEDAAGNVSDLFSASTQIHISNFQLKLAAPISVPVVKPMAVVAGDLNHDGLPDLVSVDSTGPINGGFISVSMNRGNTSFSRAKRLSVGGQGTVDLVLGDVNGDGNLDVVTANSISGTVSVLFGNGNGTFAVPRVYKAFKNPTSVRLGDINGDGNLDIIVTNANTHQMSYLLNKGNGTFAAAKAITIPGYSPTTFEMADLNGDGQLDLAVVNKTTSLSIDVMFGNGNGTFTKSQRLRTGFSPSSLKIADIDNDGNLDIVASSASSKYVSVFQGIGNGLFSDRTRVNYIGSNLQAQAIVVADLNSDGYNDLIMVNGKGNTLGVMLGNGNGTFQTMTTMKMGKFFPDPAHAIATADFNNDGLIDVAVANPLTNDISVFFNSQPGHGDNSGLGTGGFGTLNH